MGDAACEAAFTRGTTWITSLCNDDSTEGKVCVATDGEAEAARSCSSRLGVPTTGDGDGLVKVLVGFWKGRVAGSGG